jgi:hypothetical protein
VSAIFPSWIGFNPTSRATTRNPNLTTTKMRMMMATLFFDLTTNLVVRCIPGREEGVVFNYDKNKNGEDNDDKDDDDVNNDNKVGVWAGALHWVSADGGGKAKRGTMPSWKGGKVTTTRMMMTCHVNKDVYNNVGVQRCGKQLRIQR